MSAAEKFVTEKNRNLRLTTAKPDSLEHQITVNETWLINESKKINDDIQKFVDAGDLSDQGLAKLKAEKINGFHEKARVRIEKVTKTVEEFDTTFKLPDQDAVITMSLVNKFSELQGDERMQWFRDARTGKNKELALALLRGPQTLTQLDPKVREDMSVYFMAEKDIIRNERKKELLSRGQAVIDTYQSLKRKFQS